MLAEKNCNRLLRVVLCFLFVAGCSQVSFGGTELETKASRDERMQWWRESRFGILIQWGLYSIPAGVWEGKEVESYGEWIMEKAPIAVADYELLAKQFNPKQFSAERWVNIIKRTGAKYIVFSTKHHDGFSMFDSKLTDYDVVDATPFKRDVFKELADQCKKQGLKICAYYSIMDWHHEDAQRSFYPEYNRPGKSSPTFNRYVENYLRPQLKELVINYGPLGLVWFDGEWIKDWTDELGWSVYNDLRTLQPDIIVNNRISKGRQGMQGLNKPGGHYAGDFGTPEQQVPPTGLPGVDWETCMPMSSTWAYKSFVHDWKSASTLIQNLVDIASKGGNFLLNVGPMADGVIPGPCLELLEAIGDWMSVNGQSIYGTTANPIGAVPWGRCTAKPGKLYLHVFDWPTSSRLEVPGIKGKVKKAYLLADKGKNELVVTCQKKKVIVSLPAEPLDEVDTVVVLEMDELI